MSILSINYIFQALGNWASHETPEEKAIKDFQSSIIALKHTKKDANSENDQTALKAACQSVRDAGRVLVIQYHDSRAARDAFMHGVDELKCCWTMKIADDLKKMPLEHGVIDKFPRVLIPEKNSDKFFPVPVAASGIEAPAAP